jgi:hypothetical protein
LNRLFELRIVARRHGCRIVFHFDVRREPDSQMDGTCVYG